MVPCLDSIFPDSILTYSKEEFPLHRSPDLRCFFFLKFIQARGIFANMFYHVQPRWHSLLLVICILMLQRIYEYYWKVTTILISFEKE